MAEYLKLFENHTDYEAYIADNPTTPNVSYCIDVRDVHYNPTIINFASSWLKEQLIDIGIDRNNDGEIDIYEAALYKGNFDDIFSYSSEFFTFDEFRFFTGYTHLPNTFKYCENLTSIVIPDSVTNIDSEDFYGCTGLTSITIPNSVTSIDNSAFQDCSGLTSITIPNAVTSIGDYAFNGCAGITSLTIGNSVTSIGESAFEDCTSLTSVTIPNAVTSIGDYAFDGCITLNSVTVEATTPPELGIYDVFENNASGRKIYVPAGSVNTYKAATNWSTYASDIEAIPAASSE